MADSSGQLMSVEVLKAVVWGGFSLCVLGFCARAYIRYSCFRRFMMADYLMLAVLCMLLGTTLISQTHLDIVYMMADVDDGRIERPPNFMDQVEHVLKALLAHSIICNVALYGIKLNFLLFFRRLGASISHYPAFWWAISFITFACFGVTIGLLEYKCTMSSLDIVFGECTGDADVAREVRNMIISSSLDAATDVLILGLPISLLWGVTMPRRKKAVLVAVFSLTIFTIIVTIVRGTLQIGKIERGLSNPDAIGWVCFWLVVESTTAYVIACLASFRSLFVYNERSHKNSSVSDRRKQAQQPRSQGFGARMCLKQKMKKRGVLESLMETFMDMEDTTTGTDHNLNSTLPSGEMSVDFSHDEGWIGLNDSACVVSRPSSARPLTSCCYGESSKSVITVHVK